MKSNQKGGNIGYILNVESPRIGGKAEVLGYTSQPEYLDGKLVKSTNQVGQLENNNGMSGGGVEEMMIEKKTKNSNNKHKKSNRKKKNKKNRKSRKYSKYNRKQKSKNRNRNRNRKKRTKKRNKQSGGNIGAEQNSIFSDVMENRQFGCKQPMWDSNCV